MYKIPKNLVAAGETLPVLTSSSRKPSQMARTQERQRLQSTKAKKAQPPAATRTAALEVSLEPRHRANKSFNVYEGKPNKSSNRLPQKSKDSPGTMKSPEPS